jgi:hypothetical protein
MCLQAQENKNSVHVDLKANNVALLLPLIIVQLEQTLTCEIWTPTAEDSSLPRYDNASIHEWLPMLWRIIMSAPSGSNSPWQMQLTDCLALKRKSLWSLRHNGNPSPITECHIPERLNPWKNFNHHVQLPPIQGSNCIENAEQSTFFARQRICAFEVSTFVSVFLYVTLCEVKWFILKGQKDQGCWYLVHLTLARKHSPNNRVSHPRAPEPWPLG